MTRSRRVGDAADQAALGGGGGDQHRWKLLPRLRQNDLPAGAGLDQGHAVQGVLPGQDPAPGDEQAVEAPPLLPAQAPEAHAGRAARYVVGLWARRAAAADEDLADDARPRRRDTERAGGLAVDHALVLAGCQLVAQLDPVAAL